MKQFISNLKPGHFLAAIIAFFAILDLYFLINNLTPQSWDQSLHLRYTLEIFKNLKSGYFLDALTVSSFYPPFFYWTVLPIYLFKTQPPYPLFVNIIYLIVGSIFLYKLATKNSNSIVALLSVIIFSSFPFVINQRHNFLLDFPVTVLIILSWYFFEKAMEFLKKRDIILSALLTGACLLTKEFSAIYLLPYYLLTIFFTIRKIGYPDKVLPKLGLHLIVTCLFCSLWYLPNLHSVVQGFNDLTMYAKLEKDPFGFKLASFIYYFDNFKWTLSPIFFYLLIPSFFLSLLKLKNQNNLRILVTIIFGYIAFSLIPNKDPRYILPLFPLFAIIIAQSIASTFSKKPLYKAICSSVTILCFSQSLTQTIGWPDLDYRNIYTYPQKPDRNNWHIIDLVLDIGKYSDRSNQIIVSVLPDHPQINANTIQYYLLLNNISTFTHSLSEPVNQPIIANIIDSSDFIISKDLVPADQTYSPVFNNVINANTISTKNVNFKKVSRYPLPDNSQLILYKNKTH